MLSVKARMYRHVRKQACHHYSLTSQHMTNYKQCHSLFSPYFAFSSKVFLIYTKIQFRAFCCLLKHIQTLLPPFQRLSRNPQYSQYKIPSYLNTFRFIHTNRPVNHNPSVLLLQLSPELTSYPNPSHPSKSSP